MRATLLCCVLASGPASPDILPPGHKPVRHEIVLVAPPALESRRFLAASLLGPGPQEVTVNAPFTFSSKYDTRIYALGDGETLAPAARAGMTAEWAAAHASCAVPVRQIASVPVTSPLARVLTTCRVVAVTEREVQLEVVSEERFDAADRRLDGASGDAVLIGIAALGAAGIVALVTGRRRRRAV